MRSGLRHDDRGSPLRAGSRQPFSQLAERSLQVDREPREPHLVQPLRSHLERIWQGLRDGPELGVVGHLAWRRGRRSPLASDRAQQPKPVVQRSHGSLVGHDRGEAGTKFAREVEREEPFDGLPLCQLPFPVCSDQSGQLASYWVSRFRDPAPQASPLLVTRRSRCERRADRTPPLRVGAELNAALVERPADLPREYRSELAAGAARALGRESSSPWSRSQSLDQRVPVRKRYEIVVNDLEVLRESLVDAMEAEHLGRLEV